MQQLPSDHPVWLELRMAAIHVGVDADDAVDVARSLAGDDGADARESVVDALVEQLLAGVGLEAATSALRDARPTQEARPSEVIAPPTSNV